MAVERWGKDCEATNAALRGLVTNAKAAFAALRGERVNIFQGIHTKPVSCFGHVQPSPKLFNSRIYINCRQHYRNNMKLYNLGHGGSVESLMPCICKVTG